MTEWIDETHYTSPVIGVDEVGRGPWAGPVIAVAVHLNPDRLPMLRTSDPRWSWIRDSKKVTPQRREILYDFLTTSPDVCWSAGMASVEEIDAINIRQATLQAMHRAYQGLNLDGGTLLVDGCDAVPCSTVRSVPLIQGDNRSFSIATASIIAKVYRDRWMDCLHQAYPMYGWYRNRGYGTLEHRQAIQEYGITPHHRRSFKPITQWIQDHV